MKIAVTYENGKVFGHFGRTPAFYVYDTETLEAGQKVFLRGMNGQAIPVTVTAKDEMTITFDANHEMAGKELNFRIELLEVLEQ